MKSTLLELVQDILSSMDSDEVNSIDDTVESAQVTTIVKTVYNDIISSADIPEHESLFQLTASGSSSYPTVMTLPSNLVRLDCVKYNKATSADPVARFDEVFFLDKTDFFQRMHRLRTDTTNVGSMSYTVNANSTLFYYVNDTAPSYFTTFDDYTLVFDSYDNTVDSTLQQSKTFCTGLLDPTWTRSDSFVPDLDTKQFSLLFNEAKALAFAELKQETNAKAEKAARRGWVNLNHSKNAVDHESFFAQTRGYGRRP